MNPTNYSLIINQAIAINGTERWDIYHRLQELEIPCQCLTNQPLTVEIASPNHLLQVWSVIRRTNASRHDLLQILDKCWQIASEN